MIETQVVRQASDWDFRGSDTQYGTHGIHTYVAAMIPQLAKRLIEEYTPPRGKVLDPFCGGGSVLVEAVNSGRPAIGRDVNRLAVLISKAKTTPVDPDKAFLILDRITNEADQTAHPPLIEKGLAFWFKPEHTGPLYSLRQAIVSLVDDASPMSTLFHTIFSSTVRDVSLTYRNEVRLRRMTLDEIARFNVNPIVRFRERATRAIIAVAELPSLADADVAVGTAQNIELDDGECEAIVCSPPYGDERNGVSYTQFSKNMLAWLGYSNADVKASKSRTLGWGNEYRPVPASPTLEAALEAICEFPDSVKKAVSFYADYQIAIGEMARVTRGPIVIVIGQRVLRDTVFDNGTITMELMRNVGASLTDVFHRSLPSKRLPKMRKFGAGINRETILVFRR
jgi:hypothetical protein